jgi:hypothetical protein
MRHDNFVEQKKHKQIKAKIKQTKTEKKTAYTKKQVRFKTK